MSDVMEMARQILDAYRGVRYDAIGRAALKGGYEAAYKLLNPANPNAPVQWISLDASFDSPEEAKVAAQVAARKAVDSRLDSIQS